MKCMVVNNEYFYEPINGFDFEEGYHYKLKIKREKQFADGPVPADASSYRYQLIKVLKKTKADK